MGFVGISGESLTSDQIRYWIENGKCFAATTGPIVLAGAANIPLSIFNANTNTVNVLVFSIVYSNAATNGSDAFFKYTTADPVYGTNPAYQNLKAGGPASGLPVAAVSFVATTQTAPTAPFIQYMRIATGTNQEGLLVPNANILLPQGSSNGLTIWQNASGATTIGMSIMWAEL